MSEDERVGQVIQLRPDDDLPDGMVMRRERDYGTYCGHELLDLDSETQRCYCRTCKKEVPLFDALLRFADDYARWKRGYDEARKRCKRAREDLEDVERQLRNAKARLRRAVAKAG